MKAPRTFFYRPLVARTAVAVLWFSALNSAAGPISTRAQDPQMALAESSGLALAMRVQGQKQPQAQSPAASGVKANQRDGLNPDTIVVQAEPREKFKLNPVSLPSAAGAAGQQADCQVNFVPLPTPAYNKGLRGAPASTAPTYVISKGTTIVKC